MATVRNVGLLKCDAKATVLQVASDPSHGWRAYCAYGYYPARNTSGPLLAFNGEPLERPMGMYLLGRGYRAYQPLIRRFLSPDSFSPFGTGGLNAYAFVVGDPVNAIDPSGHAAKLGVYLGYKRGDIGVDAFMAKHPLKDNERAITVHAHGRPGTLRATDGPVNGDELVRRLDAAGFNTREFDIHCITCHSGDPTRNGGPSLIQQIHSRTGRAVHGYSAEVYAWSPLRSRFAVSFVLKQESWLYSPWFFNYQPVAVGPLGGGAQQVRFGESLNYAGERLRGGMSTWD